MPIATLRALQNVIASAIDDIERIYSGAGLDYPSHDEPRYKDAPPDPAEALRADKRVLAASAMIVAAAGELSATVNKPWFNVVDGVKSGHLAASLFYLEKSSIVEILREAGPSGAHVKDIAKRVDEIRPSTGHTQGPTDPRQISHILRLLATYHWIKEVKPDVFANNRMSSFVDTGKSTKQIKESPETKFDETDGAAAYLGALEDIHTATARLPEWLITGGYGYEGKKKWAAPFNLQHETDLVFYEYIAQTPNSAQRVGRFGHAMNGTRYWEELENMVDGFPWKELPKDALVVDVGGGIGSAAMTLARAMPHLRLLVQDREEVVALAPQSWGPAYAELFDTGRVTFQAHDLFDPQGSMEIKTLGTVTTPAHVYILRFIVHNWRDPDVKRMLQALRANAGPHSRLLIVEIVPAYACVDEDAFAEAGVDGAGVRSLAPEGSPVLANLGRANANGYLLDISMMSVFDARERTFRELAALSLEAGWKLTRVKGAVGSLWEYITAEPV